VLTEFGRASCASLFFQYEDIGEGVEISREYDKFEDKTRYTLTLNHLGPEYLRPNEDINLNYAQLSGIGKAERKQTTW